VVVHNDRSGTKGHVQRGKQTHLLVGICARDRYTPLPARPMVRTAPQFLHDRPVFAHVCNLVRNTGGGGWLTKVHGGRYSGHRGRLPLSPSFMYVTIWPSEYLEESGAFNHVARAAVRPVLLILFSAGYQFLLMRITRLHTESICIFRERHLDITQERPKSHQCSLPVGSDTSRQGLSFSPAS